MADQRRQQDHPEADRLTAFAERNLTRGERAEVVEHLAGCARCREVLFLAHDAAQEEAASVAVSRPEVPQHTMRHWLRLGWPMAAYGSALLVLGFVSVLWYARANLGAGPSPGRQQAVVTPQPQPATAPPMTAHPVEGQEEVKKAAPASQPSTVHAASAELAVSAPAEPLRPAADATANQIEQQYRMAAAQAEARRSEARFTISREGSSEMKTAIPAEQNPLPASSAAPPSAAVSSSFDAMPPEKVQAESGQPWKAASEALDGGAAPVEAINPLPSGEPMADSVDLDGRRVALDARGALFVSLDQGAHWRRIPQQWKGKATMLTLAPASDSLLLWNDKSAAWRSIDGGESWTPFVLKR